MRSDNCRPPFLALDEPREALARLNVAEDAVTAIRTRVRIGRCRRRSTTRGWCICSWAKRTRGSPQTADRRRKSEHQATRRGAGLGRTIEAMKRASVDTVHGDRANERLREAERLLEELQNLRRQPRVTAASDAAM